MEDGRETVKMTEVKTQRQEAWKLVFTTILVKKLENNKMTKLNYYFGKEKYFDTYFAWKYLWI